METNGRHLDSTGDPSILHWAGRLFTAEDLRSNLNGHRELVVLPRTIITPLAIEELRARGVRLTRRVTGNAKEVVPSVAAPSHQNGKVTWGFAQDRSYPLVASAVQAVQRDGLLLKELPGAGQSLFCRWSRAIAECVVRGE